MISLSVERRAAVLQLVRFLLVGGFITGIGAVIYYACAEFAGVEPLVANLIAYTIGVIVGYALHSGFSFRGHGQRGDLSRTGAKFVAVNLVGLGLNSLWVWSLVHLAGGPNWWPIMPMVLVTPLTTFVLHRRWTFG